MTKVLIIGAGAVGMDLGARISASSEVYFLTKRLSDEPKLEVSISNLGEQTSRSYSFKIFDESQHLLTDFDFVFVCVKAFDLESVMSWIQARRSTISSNLVFGFFSNGLGIWDLVKKMDLNLQSFRALCWFGVKKESPFKVVRTGAGHVSIGFDEMESELEQKTIEVLSQPEIDLRHCESATFAEWEKAVWNAALNPLGAAFRVSNGEILADKKLHGYFMDLLDEGIFLAFKYGVLLGSDFKAKVLEATHKTSKNRNSLLQDLENESLATEYPWFTPNIVKYSKLKGIELASHQMISNDLIAAWPNRQEFSVMGQIPLENTPLTE